MIQTNQVKRILQREDALDIVPLNHRGQDVPHVERRFVTGDTEWNLVKAGPFTPPPS